MGVIFLCTLCCFVPTVLIAFGIIVFIYLQKDKTTTKPEKFEEAEFRDA